MAIGLCACAVVCNLLAVYWTHTSLGWTGPKFRPRHAFIRHHVQRWSCAQGADPVAHHGSRKAVQRIRRRTALQANSGVVEVTSIGELDAAVLAGGLVVVDLYADWCFPCKMLKPTLSTFADRVQNYARNTGMPRSDWPLVFSIDTDIFPETTARLRADGLPTIVVFKDGAERGRLEGAVLLEELESLVAGILGLEAGFAGLHATGRIESMEELELAAQLEDTLVLSVLAGGEEASAALESALEMLPQKLRAQPAARVVAVDATTLPAAISFTGISKVPAVLLYDHGSCVATLQGEEVTGLSAGNLAQVVNSFFKPC